MTSSATAIILLMMTMLQRIKIYYFKTYSFMFVIFIPLVARFEVSEMGSNLKIWSEIIISLHVITACHSDSNCCSRDRPWSPSAPP